MENIFGLSSYTIKEALQRGIKIKKGTAYVDNPGYVSLVYIPILNKFVLAYGTCALDSGYVDLDKYGKEWFTR